MNGVTLTINDDLGGTREVSVESKRFTIGRTPENDLAIPNSNLSRRHAVIEMFEGVVQITDCGSQNGTQVNGSNVVASAILHDGDLITLAGVCDLAVTITDNGKSGYQVTHPSQTSPVSPMRPAVSETARPNPKDQKPQLRAASKQPWLGGFGIPLIVAATVGMVIVIGVALLLLLFGPHRQRIRTDTSQVTNHNTNVETADDETATNTSSGSENTNSGSTGQAVNEAIVEKMGIAVMQRISTDDKPYSFSEKALKDIGQKIASYRTSVSLPGYLNSVQRSSAALGALAREQGLEPGLLIYTVLAKTDGGRLGGDPLAVGRGIISDLLAVRATFGTTDSESSLILLAAYKMGGGGKRSHPLLATIRRLVKHPLTQRNVWYLNEQGGLDAEVYDFVVSFLALAVIAQSPAQFGVPATPLVF